MKVSNLAPTILCILIFTNASPSAEASSEVRSESSQQNAKSNAKEKELSFVLKEKDKVQTLKIKHVSEYKIEFTLKIDGPCKKTISGIAIGARGDYENEEDEKGEMYPAIAYEYEGKDDYVLSIGIAVETVGYKQDKAILLEAEDKSGCPVTVKTMKLVKK